MPVQRLPSWLQAYDRPNSAYMLFYERADELEPVAMLEEAVAAPSQEAGLQPLPLSADPDSLPIRNGEVNPERSYPEFMVP